MRRGTRASWVADSERNRLPRLATPSAREACIVVLTIPLPTPARSAGTPASTNPNSGLTTSPWPSPTTAIAGASVQRVDVRPRGEERRRETEQADALQHRADGEHAAAEACRQPCGRQRRAEERDAERDEREPGAESAEPCAALQRERADEHERPEPGEERHRDQEPAAHAAQPKQRRRHDRMPPVRSSRPSTA